MRRTIHGLCAGSENLYVIIIFALKTLIVMIPKKVTLPGIECENKLHFGPLSKCSAIQGLVWQTLTLAEQNSGPFGNCVVEM